MDDTEFHFKITLKMVMLIYKYKIDLLSLMQHFLHQINAKNVLMILVCINYYGNLS